MGFFKINPEITVGNILTIGTLLISVIALLIAWRKDQKMRQKEYAAPIRRATGVIAVKLERWQEISISFFNEIQPFITDADVSLASKQDVVTVRDKLWRDLVTARSKYTQQILNENIETSYAELHGYDPRIQELYVAAVSRLRAIDQVMFNLVLELTQNDIQISQEPYQSAKLGNSLRETCVSLMSIGSALMDMVIKPFQKEMEKVIKASDGEIMSRKIKLSTSQTLFSLDTRVEQISKDFLNYHKLSRNTAKLLLLHCEPRPNPVFGGGRGEFTNLLKSLLETKSQLIINRNTSDEDLLEQIKSEIKGFETSSTNDAG